ncbi:MAG: PDZ domain-containing protein [Phycisphaerales bacterium JB059]
MSGTRKMVLAAGLAIGLGVGTAQANGGPEHAPESQTKRESSGELVVEVIGEGSATSSSGAGSSEGVNFTVGACPPDEPESKHAAHDGTRTITRRQMIIKHDLGDGQVYELKVNDGDIIVLRNGEKLRTERIKKFPGKVKVLGEDGEELTTFELEGMKRAPKSGSVQKLWFGEGAEAGDVVIEGDVAFGFSSDQDSYVAKAPPPVMLGIRMGEPGAALRAHLDLGDTDAILVEGVTEGLAADRAGLKKYDVIISVDGSGEANGEVLHRTLSKKRPGDELRLVVVRGCDKLRLRAELDAYNAEKLSANRMFFDRAPENGQAEVFRFRSMPQIAPGRPFIWRDHRDELLDTLHEKLRGRLTDEQIEQTREAIREALESADFDFEWYGPNLESLSGMMEFRWDGKDHKLVIPKGGQWQALVEEGLPSLREELRHEAHDAERKTEEINRRLSERLEELSEEIERLRESLEDLD